MKRTALLTLAFLLVATLATTEPASRKTISLDGVWQIAEGGLDAIPANFAHEVPVPGLVSLATPPFDAPGPKVGNRKELPSKDPRRDAFWYRRTFTIPGPIPDVATLKVSKAMFGTRVFLNGTLLGDHAPCFTPGYFDAKSALKTGDNELIIRVGADREAVTTAIPSGFDYEKEHYFPGIFDSVELVLAGTPHIVNVQIAPDVPNRQARVRVWLKNATDGEVTVEIREAKSSKSAGTASARMAAGPEQVLDLAVPVSDCRLWSPENPFLYELIVHTTGDTSVTRFGMREFKFDPATGKALLNGKPYGMRGSNITLYRFFEDPECGDLPWREDWVRLLHQRVKDMHWNCLRYCIGFPPEAWYRIADEEGILIQDEFPIWFGGKNWSTWPKELKSDELAKEYAEWMRERWNHPSVVIWDANNETSSDETGPAIQQVRDLDLSRRPWDNSYMPPAEPGDVLEQHPYHFQNADFKLSGLGATSPAPWQNAEGHGVVINEYGWLWLNRDGTPTTLTEKLYRNLLGENSATEQRRQLYARYTAAETEFWRSRRTAAAVMHFTTLGHSRPDGQTSDHWTDMKKLTWEPEFYRYVRDAFAPVGLAIDAWAEDYPPGKEQAFPVIVVNDLDDAWKGEVQFQILRKGKAIIEQHLPAEVAAHDSSRMVFSVSIPKGAGDYQAEAVLPETPTGPVRSLRDFAVLSAKQRKARETASQQSRLECNPQDYYVNRADGKAGRAIKLSFPGVKLDGSASVTVECAGRAETTPFDNLQGINELTVLMPEGAGVAQDCPATFTLRSGSLTLTESVTVPAKRQWTVYIYPHAHVDIGYTAPQDIIEKVHVRNVEVGIDLGQKTANYPAGARHVWNPEAQWVVDTYLRDATPEKKAAFLDAVKQGWIALDANYDNANTSACSDEEFLRFFRNGIELRKMTGQPVDTLVQFDIPGMSWGVTQAAAQCGVRGVFSFPNHLDRIGTVREAWEHKPFWWVAPDGKTRVLFVQGWPYGMGYVLKGSKVPSPPYRSPSDQYPEEEIGRIPSPVQEYRKDVDRVRTDNPSANFLDPFIFDDTRRLEKAGSPYDIYAMTWSMADNSFVDADLPEAVKAWNEKYAYPKLVIASAHDILTAFETKFGAIIPEVRGDYTEYWTDGLGSDALRVGYNRLAKERLVQAETLWTMLQRTVPAPTAAINDAWRWVFLGSEHTWGYYNPASPHAKRVEQVKASYFENADKTSRQLLEQAIAPISKPGSDTFAVLNTLSWNRTGLVTVAASGNRVLDDANREVPAQRLSTGELAFLASDVPAQGARTYLVTEGNYTGAGCKVDGNTLDNGLVKVTLDSKTGDISSLIADGHEYVDAKSPYALNSYRYLRGADTSDKAEGPTGVVIRVKEAGPLVASLMAESAAAGCNKLTREVRLIAGTPWVECSNVLDKISTRDKEGVHFGFAFNVPGGTTRMDIPWGVMIPEKDQIPGGNRNWLAFQRWVDISNDSRGVTWTAIETPLIEFGDLTANILGGARGAKPWLQHLPETQTLFSWALNNHWHTNFPLEQGGLIPYHYAVLPHGAYDSATANRFGLEQNRPLIAVPVDRNPVGAPLVTVDSPRVFVSTLKPSEDGKATIVRLRSVSDVTETVRLSWPAVAPRSIRHCLADEVPQESVKEPILMLPHGSHSLYVEFP